MKKFLCLFLAAISIFSLILPAFAADGEQGSQIKTDVDLSKSTITEDFVNVFGGEFKVSDYPYNALDIQEKNIYFITCVENYVHDKQKSEMYFYFYNPTKKVIDTDSENNKVRASYSRNENEVSYCDYKLTFVNSDSDGVLMKFKVKSFFTDLAVDQSERCYSIAGVELVTHGEPDGTIIDYGVGKDFTFRDNENGFVMQGWKESVTVETEVKHTYYRFYDPDNVYQAIDLQSVYFSIPNDIINEYGYLEAISAKWEECEMYPILVTDNEELSILFEEAVFNSCPSSFIASFGYKYGSFLTSSMAWPYFEYGYDPSNTTSSPSYVMSGILPAQILELIPFIGGSFYVEDSWSGGPQEVVLSSDKLLTSMDKYGWDDVNFVFIDKSNYGDNKKAFSVYTLGSTNSLLIPDINLSLISNPMFRKFLGGDYIEYPELFAPLKKVEAADLSLSEEEFSKKFLVSEDDVESIKNSYSDNETLYILNYTVTNYEVYDDVAFGGVEIEDIDDSKSLIAETTAIRNFDLIEAEFNENGVVTILPFVSNPTNFIADITTPNKDDRLPLWLIILIICVVVLIAVKIYKKYRKARRERKFERKFLK